MNASLSIAASLALAGCSPVGLPPLGMAASGGVGGRTTGNPEGVLSVEGSVRPLEAVGALRDRPADVGVGFAADLAGDFVLFGPSLDARAFPVNRELSKAWRARLGVGLEGRVYFDDRGRAGPSAALYVTGELVPWVDGECGASTGSKSVLFGCYYGEGAVALRAQTSYSAVADVQAWTLTFGLEFRVPLLVGILFFIPH